MRLSPILILCWVLFGGLVASAQDDAAFNVNEIASAVVQLENIDRDVIQSGVTITSDGFIVSANVDLITEPGDFFEVSMFTALDVLPEKRYIGEAILADPDDVVIVIQIIQDIDGNPVEATTLDLPHVNPIATSVTVDFLDTIFTLSYPSVGGGYLTTPRGQIVAFDKVTNFVTEDLLDDILYYQSDVTTDFEGLGGLVTNFAGQFVGIAVELPVDGRDSTSDDVLVQVAPITSLCITIRDICNDIMEGYRPTPENRTERPAGRALLSSGIGMVTGQTVPNGEMEVEYYCRMLGLRARMDAEETVWECFSPSDDQTRYMLSAFDYDLICQQTYRNPAAFAIQDGNRFLPPAKRWRCYR